MPLTTIPLLHLFTSVSYCLRCASVRSMYNDVVGIAPHTTAKPAECGVGSRNEGLVYPSMRPKAFGVCTPALIWRAKSRYTLVLCCTLGIMRPYNRMRTRVNRIGRARNKHLSESSGPVKRRNMANGSYNDDPKNVKRHRYGPDFFPDNSNDHPIYPSMNMVHMSVVRSRIVLSSCCPITVVGT
ncbi:hypothetical protein P153DRAFT_204696 [Dothidotthia symphoricarpi CBS 119687]|uniref:Secreted protein n=1 Tax=Dothidotthia symphoricarpi CBS 119687 TaxID=1392245 RepID=A0A6A6AGS5_9PLEO|nr:uncharacterized protein P153DRAFT_204696 [Dothidotthia symphoricarpi CBS 119687]KAF2130776.1 hypothetical protein P153DRAFT_204696 [Dothidotthia symphoricarpi CBS 119687]